MLMGRATKHTLETNKERGCRNRSGQGSVSPRLCHLRVTHGKGTATNSFSAKYSCSRTFCLQKETDSLLPQPLPQQFCILRDPSEVRLSTAGPTCKNQEAAATQRPRKKAPRLCPDP